MGSAFLRFLAGGVVTYATTLLVMGFWLALVGIPELIAYALTHTSVLIVGFLINRYWIFRATAGNPTAQGIRFVLANSAFRVVDWCVYSGIAVLLDPPVFLTVLSANLLVLPLKFVFYRQQVFGEAMERVT